jgi:hypothetical protein
MSAALFVPALAWLFAQFGVQKGFWGITATMLSWPRSWPGS